LQVKGDPHTAQPLDGSADLGLLLSTPAARVQLIDRARISWWLERIGPALVVAATIAAVVTPIFYVFRSAFSGDAAGLRQFVHDPSSLRVLLTTVGLAAGSAAVALVLGTVLAVCAYGLPSNRRWLGAMPFIPLVIPQISFVVGYIFLLSPSAGYINSGLRTALPFLHLQQGPFNIYSIPWIIVMTGISMSSLVYLFVRNGLGHIHQDLLDSAAAAGAGPPQVFFRVLFPLLRPSLIFAGFAVVLIGLGQFTVPLLLGTRVGIVVLTTQMYASMSQFPINYPLAASYGLPILVLGLIFVVIQRVLLRDQDRFITTGGRGARAVESRGRVRQVVLIVYALIGIVLPLAAMILVSFQPYWSGHVSGAFTLANFKTVIHQQQFVQGIAHSLFYAGVTVAILLPLGYVCARTIYNRANKRVLGALQDIVISLPLGIPAVILGTGFLLAYTQSPLRLYGTSWALILVYVTIMIPFTTRLLLASMINLGHDVLDAASVNGAGALRRTAMIDWPMLRVAMGTAAALVVVLASQEFAASVLVRSPQTPVMGTVLYDLFNYGSYPDAAVMGLLSCIITGLGVALAMLIGGRGVFGERNG
jgi:iron(III) transport system permease protein